jgi:hypothetical protein
MEKIEIKTIESLTHRRKELALVLEKKENLIAEKGICIKENLLPILISTLIKRDQKESNKEWVDDAIAESINFAFTLTEDSGSIKEKIINFCKKILGIVVKGFVLKK